MHVAYAVDIPVCILAVAMHDLLGLTATCKHAQHPCCRDTYDRQRYTIMDGYSEKQHLELAIFSLTVDARGWQTVRTRLVVAVISMHVRAC